MDLHEPSPSPSRRILVHVLAACICMLVILHVAIGALIPSIHGALSNVPRYSGQLVAADEFPTPPPRLVMIGAALSGLQPKGSLYEASRNAMGFAPAEILNWAYQGRMIGDLFSLLVRAERMGATAAIVEVNLLFWNDRIHRPNGPRPALRVVTEEFRADDLFFHVRSSVQIELLNQLGVNGTLGAAARLWSPTRLRRNVHAFTSTSSITGGLFSSAWWYLLGPDVDVPRDDEAAWKIMCRNFAGKRSAGIDMDLLDDMFKFAGTARIRTVFFTGPMNRQGIVQRCGVAAMDRIISLRGEIAARAKAAGVTFIDASPDIEDRQVWYKDYAHLKPGYKDPYYRAIEERLHAAIKVALGQ